MRQLMTGQGTCSRALTDRFPRFWNWVIQVPALVLAFRNWHVWALDRLGLRKTPYRLITHSGISIDIRPGTGDRMTARETFVRMIHTRAGQRLEPGDTVVDVGANIGCFTMLAAQRVGASGRVFSLEPANAVFARLGENVGRNRMGNVRLFNKAMSGTNGTALLHIGRQDVTSSLFSCVNGCPASNHSEEVETLSLQEFMKQVGLERIDYLKLDCEGAEHQILRTIGADLAQVIGQISVELHAVEGECIEATVQHLLNLGYGVVRDEVYYFFRQ